MYLLAALPTLLGSALLQYVEAKAVFAHFMVQNSYSYSQSDWANDINTAKSIGIDGFALNIAQPDYEVDRLVQGFAAAESAGFKLFYSFDMSYSWSSDQIVQVLNNHISSTANYIWNNKLVVSTFQGEAYGNDFWNAIKNTMSNAGHPITFSPAFISYRDPSLANQLLSVFPALDGFFNWWSWPADVQQNLTTDTDVAYQNAVKQRTGPYIMSVSPWQFKELGGTNDWVEQSDYLWMYRWQQAIQLQPDIVEIVTWNDYAESHYIGEINPNVDLGTLAPQYVNGFPHSAWRTVAQYYISWYKNGVAPTVTNDQIIFWYRTHPKGVSCSSGDRPRNADYPADAVFALALLKDSATISLDIGSNHYQWNAGPGASMGAVPFPSQDAQIPYFQIIQNGVKVKDGYGSAYVTNSCSYYNFNPFVGSIG